MPKQIVKIDRFEGGISEASDARDIAPNELVEATGVMVEDMGKIKTTGKNADLSLSSDKTVDINPGYGLFAFNHDYLGAGSNIPEVVTGVTAVDDLEIDNGTIGSSIATNIYSNVTLYEDTGLSVDTGIKATITIGGTNNLPDFDVNSGSGNNYTWTKVGDLDWMQQDWKAVVNRQGSTAAIAEASDDADWTTSNLALRANPNGDSDNVAAFGLLYNHAAITHDDFPPDDSTGWRVATDDDWKNLEGEYGMSVGNQDASSWRDFDDADPESSGAHAWKSDNALHWTSSGFHTNTFLSARGGGSRSGITGAYYNFKRMVLYWTDDNFGSNRVIRGLFYYLSTVYRWAGRPVRDGYSVRLCRPSTGATTPTIGGSAVEITANGDGYKANGTTEWAINDDLYIKSTDLGGSNSAHYLSVEILTMSSVSKPIGFDNYLLLHDNDATGSSYFFSNSNNLWGPAITGFTSGANAKPFYTMIDGTLRVSDGAYNNPGVQYSYIKRDRFLNFYQTDQTAITGATHSNTILDGLVLEPDHIIAPGMRVTGTGIADDTIIATVTSAVAVVLNNDASATATIADIRIFTENNLTYEDNKWHKSVNRLDTMEPLYFNFKDLANGDMDPGFDGAIAVCIEEYDDTTLDSNWADSTKAGWEFAISTIYDNVQESPLHIFEEYFNNGTLITAYTGYIKSNVFLTDHGYRMKLLVNATETGHLPERVTGFKVYAREHLGESTDWYLQARYDLEKGGRSISSSKDVPWYSWNNSTAYTRPETDEFSELISYTLETGYPSDNLTALEITPKYGTGIIANRKLYIAAPEIVDQFGNVDIKTDAMMKSHVNRFDTFTTDRMVEASVQDGDRIIKLEEFADRILQFKENKLHIINISQDIEFLEDTLEFRGISNINASTKTDIGIAFANKYGAFLYDGKQVLDLLEKKGRRLIKSSTWRDFITTNQNVSYIPKEKHLIFNDLGTGTDAYIYDLITQSWTKSTEAFEASNKTNFITDWNGDLIYQIAGDMRKWDSNSNSVSSENLVLITKDIDFGSPGVRKKVYKIYITYKADDDSGIKVVYDVNGGTAYEYDFQVGVNYT